MRYLLIILILLIAAPVDAQRRTKVREQDLVESLRRKLDQSDGNPAATDTLSVVGTYQWAINASELSVDDFGASTTAAGSVNQAAFEAAMTYCSANNITLNVPQGIYYTNGTVNGANLDTLHMVWRGWLKLESAVNASVFDLLNCNRVHIEGRGGGIDGNRANQTVNAIAMLIKSSAENVDHVVIDGDFTITESEDQGLKFLTQTVTDTMSNIRVSGITIKDCDAEGLTLDYDVGLMKQVRIINNNLLNVNKGFFTNDSGFVEDLTIKGNTIHFYGSEGLTVFGSAINVSIEGNTVVAVNNQSAACITYSFGKSGPKKNFNVSDNIAEFRSFTGAGSAGDAYEVSVYGDSVINISFTGNEAYNAGTMFEFSSQDRRNAHCKNVAFISNRGWNIADGFKWVPPSTYQLNIDGMQINGNIVVGQDSSFNTVGIQVREDAATGSEVRNVQVIGNQITKFGTGIRVNSGSVITLADNIVTQNGTPGGIRINSLADSVWMKIGPGQVRDNSNNWIIVAGADVDGMLYNETTDSMEIYRDGVKNTIWYAGSVNDDTVGVQIQDTLQTLTQSKFQFNYIGNSPVSNPVVPRGPASGADSTDRYIREIGNVVYIPTNPDSFKYLLCYSGYGTLPYSGTKVYFHWASSSDRLTWTKRGKLALDGNLEDPYWILDGDTLYMVGERGAHIGLYTAHRTTPGSMAYDSDLLEDGAASEWDDTDVSSPALFKHSADSFVLVFEGRDLVASQNGSMGLATGTTIRGVTKWNDTATSGSPYVNSDPVLLQDALSWCSEFVTDDIIFLPKEKFWYVMLHGYSPSQDRFVEGIVQSTDLLSWNEYLKQPIDHAIGYSVTTQWLWNKGLLTYYYYQHDSSGIYIGYSGSNSNWFQVEHNEVRHQGAMSLIGEKLDPDSSASIRLYEGEGNYNELFNIFLWNTNAIYMGWEWGRYDGSIWPSKNATSNFMLSKNNNRLNIYYDAGVAIGSALTFNPAISWDRYGNTIIGGSNINSSSKWSLAVKNGTLPSSATADHANLGSGDANGAGSASLRTNDEGGITGFLLHDADTSPTAASSGVLTVNTGSANNASNTGFIPIWVPTLGDTVWVPYVLDPTP